MLLHRLKSCRSGPLFAVLALLLIAAIGNADKHRPRDAQQDALSNQPSYAPSAFSQSYGPVSRNRGSGAQPPDQAQSAKPPAEHVYDTATGKVIVRRPVKADVSPPLHDLKSVPPVRGKPEGPENPHDPLPLPGKPVEDPVVQRWFSPMSAFAMPTPSRSFNGINNRNGVVPSDDNGDVGPNQVVQFVNASYQVFGKNGSSLGGPYDGNTLWQGFGGPCETTNNGDPVALYDPLADRWMLSQFAFSGNPQSCTATSYQCLAVSTTGDATGSYYRYGYNLGANTFYDYPKFGAWPDGYYMSSNRVCAPGGPSAIAFDRAKMLVGDPSAGMQEVQRNIWGINPVDLDGQGLPPAAAPGVFIGFSGTNTLQLYKYHVDWDEPTNTLFSAPTVLTTAPFDYNICAAGRWRCVDQPGTSVELEALSGQVMNRPTYRVLGSQDALALNHTVRVNTDQAGIRWYELRNIFTVPTIYQQGTYAPDTTHRWTGANSLDRAGNMGLGYNVSSTSVYPGIRYTGRLATDPLGTLPQGEATMQSGGGSETGVQRWGDYASMSVDPADECTFWYTSQYMPNTLAANWNTRIGSFKFPQCSPVSCGPGADYVITSTVNTNPYVYAASLLPGSQCDDCLVNIPLPFTVLFYNVPYNSVNAGTNGNLQFSGANTERNNTCLPYSGFNNAILPYWDDLDMQAANCGADCGIYTEVRGSAPNRTFYVEWYGCARTGGTCTDRVSFEVVMYEGQDKYDIIYGPQMSRNGKEATIGVQQGTGLSVTSPGCNTRTIAPNLLLRLQPRACQCNDNGDFVITSALGATAQPGVDFVPGSDCDDCVSPIALPFPVLFYGSTFNSVNAAANGNLQFNSGNGDWVNTCLPAASFNNTIFAYWDDLDMRPGNCPGCGIFTSVIGSAPNRIFNIEYVACPRDDCGGYINFHIYLYEGTQEKFDVIYSAIDTTNGDSATVAVQRGTGSQFTQHECVTGGLSSGLKLSFRRTVCNLPTPTPTFTSSRTPTNIPTQTPTRTVTFTNSPTPTLTSTATPTARLVAHVTWQGRPAQPNALQQLPITLTLKLGTTEVNYPSQNTDASGFFTVSVGSMPNGTYNWRVKGPKYLANTGSINLTGGAQTNVEMGLMKVGDCNNDNVISVLDFNILKGTFGKASGDPGYDARGDLNGDNAVSVLDFNLQKGNFGQGGSPPLRPTLP